MTAEDAERFWRFSLRFYAMEEVREACLTLQDEAGLNVNLVLWCCWHAANGRALTGDDARQAEARIARWSGEITRPLRALRRRVRAETGDGPLAGIAAELYERLKAAELEAERAEQALLCSRDPTATETTGSPPAHLVKANLGAYMRTSDAPGSGRLRTELPERLARRLAAMGSAAEFGGY